MIRSFDDAETESICKGNKSKNLPPTIQNAARRELRILEAAKTVEDLKIPPGNRLEKLAGSLDGFYSIGINGQWRIVFNFENGGAENVGIADYH